MKVNFKDLYDMHPNKWVVTINSEWKNGDIDTCEVFGVYNTEDEAYDASADLQHCGIFKLVKGEEEDELEFAPCRYKYLV